MIDATTEQLLTLAAAARTMPNRKSGVGVNPSTLWRWHIRGVRGVKLETLLVGGTRFTSLDALKRFHEKTTEAADGPSATPVASQRRAINSAERALVAAGM